MRPTFRVRRATALASLVPLIVGPSLFSMLPRPVAASTPPAGSAGALDTSFGTAGVATVTVPGLSLMQVSRVAVQPDGRMVIAGLQPGKAHGGVVARLAASGALDTSFGAPNGYVLTGLGSTSLQDGAGLALQPDGKVVVVGSFSTDDKHDAPQVAVARYTAAGVPDTTFGHNGLVTTGLGDGPSIHGSGVVLIPGTGQMRVSAWAGASTNFAVIGYTSTGALDSTFGSQGIANAGTAGGTVGANDLALASSGQIVAAGFTRVGEQHDTALVRFNPDGSLDSSFGSGGNQTGTVVYDVSGRGVSDAASAVTLDAGGHVLVSGTISSSPTSNYVLRLNADGSRDGSFGSAGVVAHGFGGAVATGGGITVDQSGHYLATGGSGASGTVATALGVSRLTAGATPDDSSFGNPATPGRESVDCAGGASGAGTAIAVQPDQRIVVGGWCGSSLIVARLNAGGLSNLTMTTSTPTAPAGHGSVPLSGIPGTALLSASAGVAGTPGFNTPGFNTPGFNTPGFNTPGFNTPGFNTPGFNTAGYGTPGFWTPADQSPLVDPAVASVPLSALPLTPSSIPGTPTSWEQILAGSAYDGLPLQSITLAQVLALTPAPAALHQLTLGQLDTSATALRRATLAAYLLGTTRTSALPAPTGQTWCAFLAGQPSNCTTNGGAVAALSLLDLEIGGDNLQAYYAGTPINLVGLGLANSSLTYLPVNDIDLSLTSLGQTATTRLTTPATFVSCTPSTSATCDTLADAQGARAIQQPPGATLGALLTNSPAAVGQLTLSNLLPGLVSRPNLPVESLPTSALVAGSPLPASGAAQYGIDFDLGCGAAASLVVAPALPAEFRVVPSAVTMTVGTGAPAASVPVTVSPDGSIRPSHSFTCAGTQHVSVHLGAEASSVLGATTAGVTVSVSGATLSVSNQAPVQVVDNFEPNGTAATATPAAYDTVYLGHIAHPGDLDYFSLPPPAAGSVLTVTLSHLPAGADDDLLLYGPATSVLRAAPGFNTPGFNTPGFNTPGFNTAGFNTAVGDASTGFASSGGATAPTLSADVPRLNLPLRGFSDQRGTVTETVTTRVVDGDTTPFLIQVSGYNGSSSPQPYVLRISVAGAAATPPCQTRPYPSRGVAGSLPSTPLPATTQTLILVDQKRLGDIYGSVSVTGVGGPVTGDAGQVVVGELNRLAALGSVNGVVVPIEGDPAVASAYSAWDAAPCSVAAANTVVSSINALVDRLRPGLGDLRNIVLVGSDEALPMGRVPDLSALYSEAGFSEVAFNGTDNAISRAARMGYLLSDNPYGDFAPQAFLSTQLFVPQLAVGRLVETPQEILTTLDACISTDCHTTPNSAFVTGYAPFDKGSQQIAATLQGRVPAGTSSSLVNNTWTRSDAASGLATAAHGFNVVNAHYDIYRALPAQEFTSGTQSNPLSTADLPPSLSGGIQWTIGCHAGLNVPDAYIAAPTAAQQAMLLDWPQAALRKGSAGYAGNTGYGLGDTDVIAYSERVSLYFAQNLDGSMTLGQALAFAKQHYSTLGVPSVYDAKALEEMNLYGLPTWRLGAAGQSARATLPPPPPPAPATPTLAVTPTGDIASTLTAVTAGSGRGTYYTANGQLPQTSPNEPIQPRLEVPVAPRTDGLVAHGVVIENLTSYDQAGINPVYDTPIADQSAFNPEPAVSASAFPAALQSVSGTVTPAGRRDTVVLIPGQFQSDGSSAGAGTQRLFPHVSASVLSSNATSSTAPQITGVSGSIQGGSASFSVSTPDTDVIRAVLLLLPGAGTAPQAWQHVELVKGPNGTWVGTAPVASGVTVVGSYFVQLVNAAGNVGVSSNKGRDYSAASAAGFTFGVSPAPDPVTGLYADPTTVSITPPAGVTFSVSVDGGAPTASTGSVTLTGDGAHTLTVTGSNGITATLGIPIDSHPPAITIITPAAGSSYNKGASVASSFSCTSAVSIAACSGPATVDTSTPGTRTFSVTATDVFGRTASASTTYTVVDLPPTVTFTSTPADPTSSTSAQIAYTVSDPDDAVSTLTVRCTLDTAAVPCTAAGASLAGLGTGAHTFTVTVADPAGGSAAASVNWRVFLDTVTAADGVVPTLPTLGATLTITSTGAGLPGQTIYVYAGQNQQGNPGATLLCSGTTDAHGHMSCGDVGTVVSAVGAGGITAVFKGAPGYFGSHGSAGVL